MGIYTDAKKVEAAADYCRGQLGLKQVARRHSVNVASLRLWVAAYRIHGAAGVRTKQRKYYSAEFKLTVLQRMRSEKLSRRQAAALFNVRRPRHDRGVATSIRRRRLCCSTLDGGVSVRSDGGKIRR